MNKQKIKQELRRSACEDEVPYWDVEWVAWHAAEDIAEECGKSTFNLSRNSMRTFFLLCAEAL